MFDIDDLSKNIDSISPKTNLANKVKIPVKQNLLLRRLPWALLVVVVVGAGVLVGTQYIKTQKLNQQLSELKQSPEQIAQQQTKEVIEKVGKLILLPQDEQPTVATVTDLEPLKGQAFFTNAKLNDKVLIYSVAKKAVLFRPELNLIVEVAPINSDSSGTAIPNSNTQVLGTQDNAQNQTNTKP